MALAVEFVGANSEKAARRTDSFRQEVAVSPIPANVHQFSGRNADYELIETLGEGGMGVVYKAEQLWPIQRIVALKVVKSSAASGEVVARFEAEQQALAMMNHPNVAKVLDAGTTEDGRPYFAMEYVHGEPITDYCDHHHLSLQNRLRLLIQACDGVQHAHQKTIVHRDLKPGNVLVSEEDGKPNVKIIDFGVAKALREPLTDHALITEQGRVMGTIEYMSPEQADLGWSDLDTRTDIYSLGVLAYELIAGVLPFAPSELRNTSFEEARRIVREVEAPHPWRRVLEARESADQVAEERDTTLAELGRELRGDLSWIPLKALSKDRSERYRSASEFSDDLRNYLDGMPLIAGPKTGVYRFKKLAKRYHRALIMVGTVMIVLLGMIVALTIETHRAHVAQRSDAHQKLLYRDAAARAEQAKTIAEHEAADQLINSGDLLAESDPHNAQQTYLDALKFARQAALPLRSIFARLSSDSIDRMPVIGGFGKDGIGGFVGRNHLNNVGLSSDGRFAVTSDNDTPFELRLWDLESGRQVKAFVGHSKGITFTSFSPDDKQLLSASYDRTVRLWSIESDLLATLSGHKGEVYIAVFSADGQTIASGDASGTVILWNSQKRARIKSFLAHTGAVAALAFSQDGKTLASGGADGIVKIWRVQDGTLVRQLKGHLDQVNSVAFSPDGKTLISGSFDGSVRAWSLDGPNETGRVLGNHESKIWRVAFAPDGRQIIAGDDAGNVREWDVSTGRLLQAWGSPEGQVGSANGVAVSPDGQFVVATGSGSLLRVWNTQDAHALSCLSSIGRVSSLAVSNDGVAALGSDDGALTVVDLASDKVLWKVHAHRTSVASVCISTDGRIAVSVGSDGSVKACDLLATANVGGPIDSMKGITGAGISADGSVIAIPQPNGQIALIDLNSHSVRHVKCDDDASGKSFCFSQDAHTLLIDDEKGAVRLFDTTTGLKLAQIALDAHRATALAINRESGRALIGMNDGSIDVVDLKSGKVTASIKAHNAPVNGLTFLEDNATAISIGQDGQLNLWNVNRGKSIRRIVTGEDSIQMAALSASGRFWVSIGKDGRANWRDIDSSAEELQLVQKASRARQRLEKDQASAEDLADLGAWYGTHRMDRWAVEFLQRAYADGGKIPHLLLARCYWRLGQPADAINEFQKAQMNGEAPANYIRMTLNALSRGA